MVLLKHVGRHPSTVNAFGIDKHAGEDSCRPLIRPQKANTIEETQQFKRIVRESKLSERRKTRKKVVVVDPFIEHTNL